MSSLKKLLVLILSVQLCFSYKEKGPRFQPTVGEVWPKPNSRINYGDYFEVSENLKFDVSSLGYIYSRDTFLILR